MDLITEFPEWKNSSWNWFTHLIVMALPWGNCPLFNYPHFFNSLVSSITGNTFVAFGCNFNSHAFFRKFFLHENSGWGSFEIFAGQHGYDSSPILLISPTSTICLNLWEITKLHKMTAVGTTAVGVTSVRSYLKF